MNLRVRNLLTSILALSTLCACTLTPTSTEWEQLHGSGDDCTIQVMSSGGFTAAYQILKPEFEATTQCKLITAYGASSGGAWDSIPERLKRGEHTDVVILSANGLANITTAGYVDPQSHVVLAGSRIGMAVRPGSDLAEIDSITTFTNTLMRAESIGYSASASGTYLSTVLFPEMGVWEKIENKSHRILSERVAAVVARGDVEIGFQQVSEILPIEGAIFVGTIPEELQKVTFFSAGIVQTSDNASAAKMLIDFLSSPENADKIRSTGLSP